MKMIDKQFYVYILAKERNGTFYVGLTSDLIQRMYQHKNGIIEGFTKEHDIKTLVYYEVFSDAENAIKREKRLKKWPRDFKMNVIEKMNPEWKDLYETITLYPYFPSSGEFSCKTVVNISI
jgi:putative endonuclease